MRRKQSLERRAKLRERPSQHRKSNKNNNYTVKQPPHPRIQQHHYHIPTSSSTTIMAPRKMSNQQGDMTPRDMMARLEMMERKLQYQKELLDTMAEEKEDVERENEVLYEELKVATAKRKGKRRVEGLSVQGQLIVARIMDKIFHQLKFLRKENLLRFSAQDGTYCARIKAEFEKAKLPFNKLVFEAVCDMTVEWQVKTRSKWVTYVRGACIGECTAAEV